jgi:hypothetical protein
MKRLVIKVITTELELEFAREQRRFFDWSSMNTITTFLINNSYDLCGKGVSLRINTLTLIARLLSFRNQNAITLTDNNTNKVHSFLFRNRYKTEIYLRKRRCRDFG